jgi:A/G-specific adenine glycosylase
MIGTTLLEWYRANKRDLPWRRRVGDAYAVWVSEIMLQQTTVTTVIPYFERWMEAFPTVRDLAAAPLDDVLKMWAGLGYYARARNLHKAAQIVVERFDGVVPRDPETILSLPGIGRYTAGAILSIAYNLDEPIVDANVIRVLSRLFTISGDPKTSASTQKQIWERAEALIPTGHASDFNQAMMELGALVCNPDAPLCWECPVNANCQALAAGSPTVYPQIVKKDKWTALDDVAVAVRNGRGEIVLAKRPASESLWGGLWELPRATRVDGEDLVDCAARAVREGIGAEAAGLKPFGTVNHIVAKRKITLHGYIADCVSEPKPATYEAITWEHRSGASRYAMATPQVRLLEVLAEFETQGSLDFG